MNCLGSESRGVKLKVATKSDVKNFGTPYLEGWKALTTTFKVKDKVKVTARSNI